MNENLIWQKTQLNLRAQSKNKASGNNSVYADDAQQDKRNLLAGRQLLRPRTILTSCLGVGYVACGVHI